jgi:hypothetical protein
MEELVQPEEAVPIKQTKKTNIALGKFTAQPFRKQGGNSSHNRSRRRAIFFFAGEPARNL